ncbi:chemotaxis protein CheW [Candidatus Cyanaurora vandensis]|uniref:chemotaxis protein CheW n=1 Tax=Candidatus Cyanaurora vandensis TaxID=2714958 RepID=UPI00257C55A3|nr:chemotaxis protein CheW [Candidatus Cyanaurora vandensis]
MDLQTTDNALQTPQGDLYLKFDLGTAQQLAFPAIGVLEVVELAHENVTPMPNVNPLLLGTCNLRGEILWLVDLSLLFRNSLITTTTGQYAVIVVQDEDAAVGLVVERIRGMAWLDSQQIQKSPPSQERLQSFVRGSFITPGDENQVLLLDPEALVQTRPWTE